MKNTVIEELEIVKSRTIILRIEPTLYEWLAQQAESNQVTVSALVRFILHQEAKSVGRNLRSEHRSHDL
jgi:hypothetical protein